MGSTSRPPAARAAFGFLTLLLATLAGCAAEDSTPKQTNGIDVTDPDAILIEGMAVTDEITPLAGVTVALLAGDGVTMDPQSKETDETGAFQFAVLDPGTYLLEASLTGHDPAVQEVRVPAGGMAGIQLMLRPTPEGKPYHETETYVSYAFCHGPIGGGCFIANTVTSSDVLPEDRPDFGYDIPNDGFEELRFEAQWNSPPTAADGGFIARNPEGLFLGCNNTQAADRPGGAPTVHYYSNNNPEGDTNGAGDPSPSREPSPVQMWIKAGQVNPEVGGCVPMPHEKGHQIWQTVRISGDFPPHIFALDTRVEVFLTFFYWQESLDRTFTVLEEV